MIAKHKADDANNQEWKVWNHVQCIWYTWERQKGQNFNHQRPSNIQSPNIRKYIQTYNQRQRWKKLENTSLQHQFPRLYHLSFKKDDTIADSSNLHSVVCIINSPHEKKPYERRKLQIEPHHHSSYHFLMPPRWFIVSKSSKRWLVFL